MAYVRLVHLTVFLLVTFSMLLKKKAGAVGCFELCSPFNTPPCASKICSCIPIGVFEGFCGYASSLAVKKMIEEHPNLCQSHANCTERGSGNFCARYPNSDIEYGWCFSSNTEAYEAFYKTSSNYELLKDYLKMPTTFNIA